MGRQWGAGAILTLFACAVASAWLMKVASPMFLIGLMWSVVFLLLALLDAVRRLVRRRTR